MQRASFILTLSTMVAAGACTQGVSFQGETQSGGAGGLGGEVTAGGTGGKTTVGGAENLGGEDAVGGETAVGGTESEGNGGSSASGGSASGGTLQTENGGSPPSGDCSSDDFTSSAHTELCFPSVFNETLLTAGTGPRGVYDEDYEGLVFRPEPNSWLEGQAGYLLYRSFTGNFLFEAEVSVQDGNTTQPALFTGRRTLAGILALPWEGPLDESVGESVHYAIKTGYYEPQLNGDEFLSVLAELYSELEDPALETQLSSFETPGAWTHVRLRLCRFGPQIWTGFAMVGDSGWRVLNAYNNVDVGYETGEPPLPALPDSLAVGLTAEFGDDPSDTGTPRIVIHRVDFRAVDRFDDCRNI
jgi:hypothetical protein